MKSIFVLKTVDAIEEVQVKLYGSLDTAERVAYKWIYEKTGGPSAWQKDEWHEMRDAMKERDVPAMIHLFNRSWSNWTDGFIEITKERVR